MSNRNFDERQLLFRGRAFKYAFFTFMLTVAVWEFLCDMLGLTAEPIGELCLLYLPPLFIFAVTCIVRDAYDPIQSRPGMIVFAVAPIGVLIVLISALRGHTALIDGKCITTDGGILLLELGILAITVIYWICYFRAGRKDGEE